MCMGMPFCLRDVCPWRCNVEIGDFEKIVPVGLTMRSHMLRTIVRGSCKSVIVAS